MRVLATDGLEKEGIDLLKQHGLEVDVRSGFHEEEFARILGEFDAIIVRTATKINKETLEHKGILKIICCATAGVDNIDVDAATEQGVVVMNVPGGNANAVAEHTLALMLNMAREIESSSTALKEGRWIKSEIMGSELQGKTLGVMGFGNIGSIVAKKAKGLGMHVIVCDPYVEENPMLEKERFVDMDTLLVQSDFVSLHVSLTDETKEMIAKRELALMKDGACLINCARGQIIDEEALKKELRTGRIKAALDVYQGEPNPDPELVHLAQIATPHTAGTTTESRSFIAQQCARQIIDALVHEKWENAVNLPPMDPGVMPYMHLAQLLGQFAARLWFVGEPKRFSEIRFEYFGDIRDLDLRMVTRAGLTGLISTFSSSGAVSLVNAEISAQNRGFIVSSGGSDKKREYTNLIAIEIAGKGGEIHRIEGIAMGENKMQIVRIDGYNLTVELSDIMLVFINEDRPGVIYDVTGVIKRQKININRFNLSDKGDDGTAMAVLSLEEPLSDAALKRISQIKDKDGKTIRFLKQLSFE